MFANEVRDWISPERARTDGDDQGVVVSVSLEDLNDEEDEN